MSLVVVITLNKAGLDITKNGKDNYMLQWDYIQSVFINTKKPQPNSHTLCKK